MTWNVFRVLVAAFACLCSTEIVRAEPADYMVDLHHEDDGSILATFVFATPAKAWVFPRTQPDLDGRPWRQDAWTVETPGVRLVQRDGFDVLESETSALSEVQVKVGPHAAPLRADYDPMIVFADGGLAHFTGHYALLPLPDSAALSTEDMPDELVDRPVRGALTIRAPGRRILFGGLAAQDVYQVPLDRDTYLYVGRALTVDSADVAAVIDGGLPPWLQREIEELTPQLIAQHGKRLGVPDHGRPTLFVAWDALARRVSLGGGVLDGLVMLNVGGVDLVEASDAVRSRVRWFLAHEISHLWLGHTISYSNREESWITEGGAELLAARALHAIDPTYDPTPHIQGFIDACPGQIEAGQSLNQAARSGNPRAPYACGAALLVVAEAGLRRCAAAADAYSFWRTLLDRQRADGEVDQEEWLAAFTDATGSPEAVEHARRFIQRGSDDPKLTLYQIFEASGLGVEMADGRIDLQAWSLDADPDASHGTQRCSTTL